jgi:hypothetical protein
MKTVLSYCSARVFATGLLPMVAMYPQQSGAENDNQRQPLFQKEAGIAHSGHVQVS